MSLRRVLIAVTSVWLGLFLCWPLIIVLRIAFATPRLAQPPYSPLLETTAEGGHTLTLTFENFALLATDPLYLEAWRNAATLAGLSAALCLLIAYPMALAMVNSPPAWRRRWLVLIILPFWTSFLLRIYALIGLLGPHGPLNDLLLATGLITTPLEILHTPRAMLVGMVYAYLPFMILPLYASLEKRDAELLEAARDLGASPQQTFWRVTLPLSLPGVRAGLLLVFVPALGEFLIPDLLGGPGTPMLGHVLWTEFFANRAWPVAAALATTLLLALLLWWALRGLASRTEGGPNALV